jgi:hypothetical protein
MTPSPGSRLLQGAEMKRLVRILWVTLTWLAAYAADSPKPVLVKATCDRETPTPLLSSFQEAIQTSNR